MKGPDADEWAKVPSLAVFSQPAALGRKVAEKPRVLKTMRADMDAYAQAHPLPRERHGDIFMPTFTSEYFPTFQQWLDSSDGATVTVTFTTEVIDHT